MRKTVLVFCLMTMAVSGFSQVKSPLITGLHVCGAISVDSASNIFISDWSGQRVGIYDRDGNAIGSIEGIGDPSGNTFDTEGNFYVSSYSYGQVWKIDKEGRKTVYADGFDVPAGLAWIDGRLYVANRDAGEVIRIERDGQHTVLVEDLPQPVSCLKLKDGALIISCLSGSPRILENNGTLSVLIPEIKSSGINIIPDGENSFIFCVISEGTVEQITLGGGPGKRTVHRTVLAEGFHTPIGTARLPDGNIIIDAWHEGVFILEMNAITINTAVKDIISDPELAPWGRLLFPANEGYWSGDTLGDLQLTWYGHINPSKSVEIVQYMKEQVKTGNQVFFDIYTEKEKNADPAKRNTGLFFFRGNPGARFAMCNAGGGFVYVGAMHDSFPHALELSKKGYNAFALIYRPGWLTAYEDLARALSFIFEHAEELKVNTDCYSLWGGSAGARMAATLGSYGTSAFGGLEIPRAGTVVMQYTGHDEWQSSDPPTYACAGDMDGIASWRGMKARLEAMSRAGIPTEFHIYRGLGHGFGLGQGTVAEGWIDNAVRFWESQM